MSGETIFDVQDAGFAYEGGHVALEQVTLSIQSGERIAVLGSNGSGKSTLLKLLDGLYFAPTGSVKAFGQPLSEEAFNDDDFNYAFRRRVGLVFQDTDVQLFSPSVWEELAFAPLQLGLSKADVEARVEEALQALRIDKLRDRPPHRLSGGEKRRVALASVLTLQPQVWLLDEPTAGLDPRSQSWLVNFITSQGHAGRTVVTATHDLSIVDAIADRVYVFDEAHHLAAQGTPREILTNNDLLLACNLSHDHVHRHENGEEHAHAHVHPLAHTHPHG
ncbi:MAG TPA: energy-coupling factor ABC transporter ATP-binding protein [Anaerolineae bacterium]|jgi:cobalt/nickel transport system ATP-binding protein